MKLFQLKLRLIVPLFAIFCFLYMGSQSARGQSLTSCTVVTTDSGVGVGASNTRTVLMLGPTLTDSSGNPAGNLCTSLEAVQAQATPLSLDVEIDNASAWGAKSTAQFATYRAIVLGDPNCVGGTGPITAAQNNATTWGPAITGPVAIVGTDPEFHFINNSVPQKTTTAQLTENAIALATSKSGQPGAYMSLSCYYHSSPANTPVPVLAPFGSFTVQGQGMGTTNNSHIVAPTNSLATTPNTLTDAGLSNWFVSTHEAFNSFPSNFTAVMQSVDLNLPYILAGTTSQVQTTPVVTDGTTATIVVFNNTVGQHVEHDLIFPAASDLTFPISNPQLKVTNKLISNSVAWPPYVIGTPFAISMLFVHDGDNAISGGTDIGSMYEDQCFNSTNAPSEPNCPVPINGTHIISKDIFDLSPSKKPSIGFGTTASFIHYYPNTIPTITTWSPSSTSSNPVCTNVTSTGSSTPASASACDVRDILVTIFGDPIIGTDGRKGAFAGVFNVPMLLSTVRVNGTQVNTPGVQVSLPPPFFRSPLTFDFLVTPAQLPAGFTTTNSNSWIAAPVSNLAYVLSSLSSTPPPLPDPPNCPVAGVCTVTSGTPGASSTANVEFTSSTPTPEPDGQYLLQWSAADTVGIKERNVQLLTAGPCPNPDPSLPTPIPPCYSTTQFSVQFDVDTTPPTVTGLTLTPNTAVPGQTITASYTCADPIVNGVASGIASCGTHTGLGGVLTTGQLSNTFTVPAGANGPQTYSVTATDVAGNSFTATATYFAGFQFFGFFAPVSNPGSGILPIINVIKAGQAVPIKWQVLDGNGVGVTGLTLGLSNGGTASGTVHLTAVNSTVCVRDTVDNNIIVDAAGNSGLHDLGGGNYQFNWKTVLPSGACVLLTVDPGDGTQRIAYFQAK